MLPYIRIAVGNKAVGVLFALAGLNNPYISKNGLRFLRSKHTPLIRKYFWKGIVKATTRRTSIDYAHFLRDLADVHYCAAEKIVLVQDNLNTHTPASLYLAFTPQEARRLTERFEWHYTPKHGSWLNMAETELSVLSRQCLNRRIEDQTFLISEVATWQAERNTKGAAANWRFTSQNARIKLRRLYPSI